MHSADSTGGRGGLNHRQTLRALKAKKEIILSAKRQQPAGASNVVVEGETPVDLGNSSLGGSGQETVRSANKRGPMVRQILRRKTAKELKAEAEEAAKAEETEEEKEIRRQAHKARKAKMAEMLAKLQQAKADEAEERRKKRRHKEDGRLSSPPESWPRRRSVHPCAERINRDTVHWRSKRPRIKVKMNR